MPDLPNQGSESRQVGHRAEGGFFHAEDRVVGAPINRLVPREMDPVEIMGSEALR